MMEAQANGIGGRIWFKDFTYYAIAFLIWGALFSFLQPVDGPQATANFWGVKVYQALLGCGFGAVCAVIFTLLQNGLNQRRTKPLSWIFAIATWIAVNFGLAAAIGRI
jgi:hypothetical protein